MPFLFVCLFTFRPLPSSPPPQTPPSPIIKGVSPLKRFLPVACALSCMPIPNSLSACRKRERRERRTKGEIAERKKGRREKKGGREKGKGRNVEGVSVTTMRQRLPTRARARTALKRGKGEKMRKKKLPLDWAVEFKVHSLPPERDREGEAREGEAGKGVRRRFKVSQVGSH